MKKIFYLSSFLLFCFTACKDGDKQTSVSENDVDAVRNFIQAALEGNYEKAETFMIHDSVSMDRMNNIKRVNLSAEEKKGLAAASIIVHSITRVNDSATVVIYSNSFKKNQDTLRALRVNGNWLVDFNYLFDHDKDTLINKPDSLSR
ncbi:MAG: DUF4878 domain-containing protein [Chitinophagaceae bacterium]|nr:DUF4878 domain-containing protein [Chitinophagaceae bacterium]